MREGYRAERARLTLPPDPVLVAKLASRYVEPTLGAIELHASDGVLQLDAGEWQNVLATRPNADGTTSLVTAGPGLGLDLDLVIGESNGTRQLTLRDGQHTFIFEEQARAQRL